MSVDTSTVEAVLPAGTPCWVELASSDVATAQKFYGTLFDWDFHVQNDPSTVDRRYTIASRDAAPTAGIRQAGSEHIGWSIHFAVHNTASTAGWVEHLGGYSTLGPIDIPERGSILHATDPSGVHVVFWAPAPTWQFASGMPGSFAGADLYTHDPEMSDRFFCNLFNLTSQQIGLGSIDYAEWRLDGAPVVYRYVMDSDYLASTPAHWLVHFTVNPARGTDAAAGQAIMLGGTVLIEPYDTPFGRIAVLADPVGAVFAVIDTAQAIEGWQRAEVEDPYDD